MENKKDSPKVYLPPPLIYLTTFFAGLLMQRIVPINKEFFHAPISFIIGVVIILFALSFSILALMQFFSTNNTVVTIRGATSLQTTGIYSISRNPMYMGFLLFYTGVSFLFGNWWNMLLLPILFLVMQEYVIKREERYLTRRFGQDYLDYKSKVRRWL